MTELDDLHRRLADLADAVGPWDDPLPEVRRRVESARRHPATTHRQWLAGTNWGAVLAAAAAVIIVGFGAVLLAHTPRPSTKAASGGVAAPDAASRASCPAIAGAASAVGTLTLSAPSRFETDRSVRVQVRFVPGATATPVTLGGLRVYVLSGGAVVGQLDPPAGLPIAVSAAAPVSVAGVFHRAPFGATCAAADGHPSGAGSETARSATARLLPPGHYELVAVIGYSSGVGPSSAEVSTVVSDPVDITVI